MIEAVRIAIPDPSLVALVGVTGSGKSTFAARHFLPTEVVSSDVCRGLVADDESDQSSTDDAFEVLHFIAGKRLSAGRLTVIDATNVQPLARRALVALAREHQVQPVAIVLDLSETVCARRNAMRTDRAVALSVLRSQRVALRRSMGSLRKEGFGPAHVLRRVEEVEAAFVQRERRETYDEPARPLPDPRA